MNKLHDRISRNLTKLLRHEAPKRNLNYDKFGGIHLEKILSLGEFKKLNATEDIITSIVDSCQKKRFIIYYDSIRKKTICASQGHSFIVVPFSSIEIKLDNIDNLINKDTVVHGTYYKFLDKIKFEGLSRMNRQNIHLGTNIPESGEVISGMRKSCEVIIYIDIHKALNDGYSFLLSKNKVVLTPGNKDGYLPNKYFKKMVDRKSGIEIR